MAIEVISEITQKNNQTFPIANANNIKGGLYSVSTIEERDSIPESRRSEGMLCYVQDEQIYYSYIENKWIEAEFESNSVGIPIYSLDNIDEDAPDEYITIVKDNDLEQSNISRQIASDGTYVDILFSAIRKLQSEVARLRNAFRYGINSYTDKDTAISETLVGLENPDEEPLWAVEEEDLSLINSVTIGLGSGLEPDQNIDVSTEGILSLTGNVTWTDDDTISVVEDPKLFAYISSSTLDITVNLKTFEEGELSIKLNSLVNETVDFYNIMICISREVDNSGSNYIYFSIGSAQRDLILAEGYYNGSTLQQYPYDIGDTYYFDNIVFTDLNLSKLNFYSKYQDFSNEVIPSAPSEQTYKFGAAHITIRSVSDEDTLEEVKEQLLNNELIFVESTNKLWIKNNDTLINIGSSSDSGTTNSGMTESEIIELLKEMGIVKEDGENLQLSDIASLTFIHEDTGTKYKFAIDSNGNLKGQLVPDDNELLENRITASGVSLGDNVRGFIGQLKIAENNKDSNNTQILITGDAKLCADRIKIGAFYAPLDTDTIFGCNRAFIELENTSDDDFALEGCYLHYTRPNSSNQQTVYHLPLTGILKAGSTYLIVGKEYAENTDANVFINVDSFDQEWYVNGELVDFTINTDSSCGYGFALTYGNSDLSSTTYLWHDATSETLASLGITSTSNFPYIFDSSFIDAIYYYKGVLDSSNQGYWADMTLSITSNTMYKNMFELDPAKQAFQACTTADSSRTRWQSTNDVWIMDLSKSIIQFPHSEDTYEISMFTPKASYEEKNVSTDKSKLDSTKPNMVTCSFGLNIYTDRCFNWISVGSFDEYLWIRKQGEETWNKFESYTEITEANIINTSSYPYRKEYSVELNNTAYARISGRFPGDNTYYTSHKCILKLREDSPSSPEVWEYRVSREDKNGDLDETYASEIYNFTLYPESYVPRIYHISDQQGFHWIEYQVWAAAANKVLEKIQSDQKSDNIIPIIINTGDMTQNGTRINEWYDYYQAGRNLFSQFEQMNVVGNNDLCGTNPEELGTGDDSGKSNSFYFHVFYCYDIDENVFKPIINNKYVPSLYYFDSKEFRFVMVNSEITSVNCQNWYGLTSGENVVNIYTGFTISSNKTYVGGFTTIYTMLYNILTTDKECIVACHEMPFTVITNDSIASGQEGIARSISSSNSLVGSHLNQISTSDTGIGTYWFSRLLEYKGVKLCIGGHKHTYACTYPLREYFLFGDNKNSQDNYSEYSMSETLENDSVTWISGSKDLTKFPLTKRENAGEASTGFYPYTPDPNLEGGVTYFMMQATGYKLTSNKELPSADQKFSLAIPQTSRSGSSDSANNNQKYPMFGIINLTTSEYTIKLIRIANIFTNYKFAQNTYSTDDMLLEYFKQTDSDNYGEWVSEEQAFLTL